jgi:hypothetical protein
MPMKNLLLTVFAVLVFFTSGFSIEDPKAEKTVLSNQQKNVIAYFKEVALGFEFGKASRITRKWTTSMKIFVSGSYNEAHLAELKLVVDELNLLITDDFEIEIVSDRKASNFHIFIGTSSDYAALYPKDESLARNNSGVYRIFWNNDDQIIKGHMFVNLNNTDLLEQRHVIREELTQSLGLGTDSPLYAESVFQSNWSTPTQYAEIDKEIIRLLYHPHMVIGLSDEEVDEVLKQILLSENRA